MKKLYNIFLLIASFALLLSACQKEEAYTPGEAETEGCYGVYFPVQDGGAVLDPAAPTVASIKVSRVNSDGAITVPYKVEDPTGSLVAGDIVFEDGQTETSFDIDFSKAEIGQQYKYSFVIEDPQYASKYNSQPVAFDFKVLREKWNSLGMCKFTDDIITGGYNIPGAPHTWEVEIQESDNKPGLYRLKNVFWNSPYEEMGAVVDRSRDRYMILHAEESKKVYIENFYISGLDLGYQNVAFGSLASYHINKGQFAQAEAFYGVNRKGVITFPEGSLLFGELGYQDGALFPSNNSGATKIVFPGVIEVDYSIMLDPEQSAYEGMMGIGMFLGKDVAVAKYAAYEGELNGAQIERKVKEISDGTEKNTTSITESSYEVLEFEKTGLYTVVVVTFDKDGKAHEYETTSFGYVAAGDSVPVDCYAGLTSTNKYFPIGQSSDQALEYYLFGNDLKALKFSLCKSEDLEGFGMVEEIMKLLEKEAVPAEVLAQINGKGYVNAFFDLTPGTEYTLLVWAFNGYEEGAFVAEAKTTGKLAVKVEDMIGTYLANVYSYFEEKEYPTIFEIAASDNAEKGNVMFTKFMNIPCTQPVYANVDTENNTLSIKSGQIFTYHEGVGGNLQFEVIDENTDVLTLQITNKGAFGTPDVPFGVTIVGGPQDGYAVDIILGCEAELEKDAEANAVAPVMEGRKLIKGTELKVRFPLIRPDFSVLPDVDSESGSVGFTVTSKEINAAKAMTRKQLDPASAVKR